MPNRIIKESACTSDTLAAISADAERLWWRLVVQADDYGCFDGRPNVILGKCLTAFIGRFTDSDVIRWLDEMEAVGLIRRYSVDGRPYIHLVKWSEHQRPARAKEPKYPLPPVSDNTCGQMLSDDTTRQHVSANAPVVGSRSRESGGGNGRAREGAQAAATTADMIGDDTIPPLKFYEQSFGTVCPQTSLEVIDEFEAKGLQPSAIKWAIYEHRLSDGRGPKHLRRIMQRLLDDGLLTAEAAEAHERERRQRTTHPRASPADDETSWIDAELERLKREMEAESA